MGSARVVATVSGQAFSEAMAAAPAGSPSSEIPDALQTTLAGLLFKVAGKEKEICNSLIGERLDLNARCRAFIEGYSARARDKLIQEHETLKAECVAQQRRIEALKTNIIELEQDFQRKNGVTVRAMTKLSDAEQARKLLSRFAPAKEITKADAAIETARHNLEVASSAEASIRQEINTLTFVERPRLNEQLRKLSAEELRMRSAITGQGFTDEELGIVVPGRI